MFLFRRRLLTIGQASTCQCNACMRLGAAMYSSEGSIPGMTPAALWEWVSVPTLVELAEAERSKADTVVEPALPTADESARLSTAIRTSD